MVCTITNDATETFVAINDDDVTEEKTKETENGNTLMHIESAFSNNIKLKIDEIMNGPRNNNGWTPYFSAVYANNQQTKNYLERISSPTEIKDYFSNTASFYMKK